MCWHGDSNRHLRHRDPRHDSRAVLKRLPCRLVLDHNGKFLEPVAPEHPSFQSLLRVLDSGRVWIKLSAPYETSKLGAPGYDDVSLLARTLAETFPERCLWASCYPNEIWTPKITYAEHLRIFTEALPLKESERKLILGENARRVWFKGNAHLTQ